MSGGSGPQIRRSTGGQRVSKETDGLLKGAEEDPFLKNIGRGNPGIRESDRKHIKSGGKAKAKDNWDFPVGAPGLRGAGVIISGYIGKGERYRGCHYPVEAQGVEQSR